MKPNLHKILKCKRFTKSFIVLLIAFLYKHYGTGISNFIVLGSLMSSWDFFPQNLRNAGKGDGSIVYFRFGSLIRLVCYFCLEIADWSGLTKKLNY